MKQKKMNKKVLLTENKRATKQESICLSSKKCHEDFFCINVALSVRVSDKKK